MNVINVPDIEKLLRRRHRLLSKLLKQALLRALTREASALEEVTEYPANPPKWLTLDVYEARKPFYRFVANDVIVGKIAVVELWLAASIARGERWIRYDANGRVAYLRNIQDLNDALALCEKDMVRFRRQDDRCAERARGSDPEHVEAVLCLPFGFTWVRLLTPTALAWEGRHMHHCIGQQDYADMQQSGEAEYFSLRNERGRPVVTLEAAYGSMIQSHATANTHARPKYSDEIDALLDFMGWHREDAGGMPPPPRNRLRSYLAHCENAESDIIGDFNLERRIGRIRLPRVMRVTGSFIAIGNEFLRGLPEILDVGGDLRLPRCTNLAVMPRWLKVAGDADLTFCTAITGLPTDVEIGSSLDLTGCTSLERLPSGLAVGQTLNVSQCWSLPHIPDSVHVGHALVRGRMAYVSVRDMNRHIAGLGWVAFRRRRA